MSSAGAMIEVTQADSVPATFVLHMHGRRKSLKAEVCWRETDKVGVRLTQ